MKDGMSAGTKVIESTATPAGIAAQQRHQEISGVRRTHYCGAYWRYGFHEDGFNSAIRVAQSLGVNWRPRA